MSQTELTQQNIDDLTQILANATNSNDGRIRYWEYLQDLGDPYALQALRVVTNDYYTGIVANEHLKAFALNEFGRTFTDQELWDFGIRIAERDLQARVDLFKKDFKSDALNLSGSVEGFKAINDYHQEEFERLGLGNDNRAWTTTQILLEDARAKDIEPGSNEFYESGQVVFSNLLSSA